VDIALKRKLSKASAPGPKRSLTDSEIGDIVNRCNTENRDTLPDALALLADSEVGEDFRRCIGSSAEWLRQKLIKNTLGKNVLGEVATEQEFDRIQSDLQGPNPTPIERLLAERASLCWFIVNWYEYQYAASSGWTIDQA
jgi:hypothetical protein